MFKLKKWLCTVFFHYSEKTNLSLCSSGQPRYGEKLLWHIFCFADLLFLVNYQLTDCMCRSWYICKLISGNIQQLKGVTLCIQKVKMKCSASATQKKLIEDHRADKRPLRFFVSSLWAFISIHLTSTILPPPLVQFCLPSLYWMDRMLAFNILLLLLVSV